MGVVSMSSRCSSAPAAVTRLQVLERVGVVGPNRPSGPRNVSELPRRFFACAGENVALPPLRNGVLPHGRWACEPADVEAAFVHGLSPQRQRIWDDWVQLTDTLRSKVGRVAAAWLAGSFLTDKPVPGDLDSVYLVDKVDCQASRLDPLRQQFVTMVARNEVKQLLNINVDSFILEWDPTSGPARTSSPDYYSNRGYWDDLWVRQRDPDSRLDSIPRRGYVEVILDGYR